MALQPCSRAPSRGVLESLVIKSAILIGLLCWQFAVMIVENRGNEHTRNAGECNRRHLTCQISAILYADRGDRRKSQSLHRAHLAIFADRGERLVKSRHWLNEEKTIALHAARAFSVNGTYRSLQNNKQREITKFKVLWRT